MLGPNENEIKPEPTSINEIQGDPGPCHQEGENIKTFVDYFIWGGDIDSKYLFSCMLGFGKFDTESYDLASPPTH